MPVHPSGLTFVYRSPYEGPLGKRVVGLGASSVLEWFQRAWTETRRSKDWLSRELEGEVYGLDSIFEAARELDLPLPKTTTQLTSLLDSHLYVEGEFTLDDHSLRVFTDDDEVELAYYFFDATAAGDRKRTAWLFHHDWHLPDTAAKSGGFVSSVETTRLNPVGVGQGATFACLLTFYSTIDSIPGEPPACLPGVRLDGLAAHLRSSMPESKPHDDTWPWELRLLRAMIDPAEDTIGAALERCAGYPVFWVGAHEDTSLLGWGSQAVARGEFVAAAGECEAERLPGTEIFVGAHVATLCMRMNDSWYQQWILFDDLWAGSQIELAESLLRYSSQWDPFA